MLDYVNEKRGIHLYWGEPCTNYKHRHNAKHKAAGWSTETMSWKAALYFNKIIEAADTHSTVVKK